MARTHTFKGSASAGYGYFAYIEDGQLVIGEDWGREGGILYRGPYQHAQIIMSKLRANAPKLANSIDKYYFEESQKIAASKEAYYIRHRFKDSRDRYGNGYSGYTNIDGLLIIEQDDPRGGGVRFEGKYEEMSASLLVELRANDPVLYDDIEKYFTKHGVSDESDRKDLGGSKTRTYTVKLMMNNGKELDAVISGESETEVIRKILPPTPNAIMLYDLDGRVMAVRSDKIYTVAIMN